MSISKLNKLSPLHSEIVKTINSFSLFGFELTQGLLELKVSFAEDLDSELEDELFAVLWSVVTNKKHAWTLDLDLLPIPPRKPLPLGMGMNRRLSRDDLRKLSCKPTKFLL